MAWGYIQSASATISGAASLTVTYATANVSAGTKLLAVGSVSNGSNPATTSVQDAGAHAFTSIIKASTGTQSSSSIWAIDTPAGDVGTKPAITFTPAITSDMSMVIQEVSGLATGTTVGAMCDGTPAANTGAAGTAAATGATTGVANDYLLAGFSDNGPNQTQTCPATADAANQNPSPNSTCMASYGNATGGADSKTFTIVSNAGLDWCTTIAAFKLAAAGGGGGAPQPLALNQLAPGVPQPSLRWTPSLSFEFAGIPSAAAGVTAAVTLAAPAGSVSVTIPGVTAPVTFAAPAGSVSVSQPGVTAPVTFAAPAGSVSVTLPGATAPVSFTAPVGSVATGAGVSTDPTPPLINLLAPTTPWMPTVTLGTALGLLDTAAAGVTAALTFTANPGAVSVTLPGVTATVVLTAPAGGFLVGSGAAGVTTGFVLAAVPGTASVSLPGVTAPVTFAAPAGSVSTGGGNVTLPGVTAATVYVAPPGFISGGVTATSPANVAYIAGPGRVAVTLPGPTARLVHTAPAGTVTAPLPFTVGFPVGADNPQIVTGGGAGAQTAPGGSSDAQDFTSGGDR